jgi:hypothetical protein
MTSPDAVRKLASSPAVQAAPPAVRNWLIALLARGEKAVSSTRLDGNHKSKQPRPEPETFSKGDSQ